MANGDQQQPPEVIGSGFGALVEGLRQHVREDLRELRDDVREDLEKVEYRVNVRFGTLEGRIKETHESLVEFAKGHGVEHENEATERREAHGLFFEFMRKTEIDEARKAGALGVFRFVVEQLSRYAPRLIGILLSAVAALLTLTGAIRIQVGG